MTRTRSAIWLATAALLTSLALNSCNVFDPFDGPSGDAQILSAARACFDRGDLACAREMYAQLSSSYADTVASETAFAILDENGASMGEFMAYVGRGATGSALTTFAQNMATLGANSERRHAIWTAFKKKDSITNPDLKNFVKFTTALALAAEFLAENAGGDGILLQSELMANPASCDPTNCLISAGCGAGSSTLVLGSAADIDTTEPTGTLNSDHLYWAFNHAYNGFNALNPSGGGEAGGAGSMDDLLSGGQPNGNAAIDQCLRGRMKDFGIGG